MSSSTAFVSISDLRKGRQVVTPRAGAKLLIVRSLAASDDHIAVIGENRKLLIFPLTELPVMAVFREFVSSQLVD